jgi:hypothetical protein
MDEIKDGKRPTRGEKSQFEELRIAVEELGRQLRIIYEPKIEKILSLLSKLFMRKKNNVLLDIRKKRSVPVYNEEGYSNEEEEEQDEQNG